MKFISILLKEGRKEDLKKKYAKKFDEDVLDWILGISDLVDFNHKYSDWVLKMIPFSHDLDMDVEIAVQLIKDFDKYSSSLEKKDIYQYKSVPELDEALVPIKEKEKQKEEESKFKKIYEDNVMLIVRPLSMEASCKYGAGTRWCTTQRGAPQFTNYTSTGQALYYIIMKQFNQTNKFYKVAIHKRKDGTESWWNANDDQMDKNQQELFKMFGSKAIEKIDEDFNIDRVINFQKEMELVFEPSRVFKDSKKYNQNVVTLTVSNSSHVPDMPGHFVSEVDFYFNGEHKSSVLAMMLVKEKTADNTTLRWAKIDIGTDSDQDGNDVDYGMDFDGVLLVPLVPDAKETFEKIGSAIIKQCLEFMSKNENYKELVFGSKSVWDPKRIRHGYTFSSNKGLIKKLVDWLDKDIAGTKLDFLVDIGKLKTKTDPNGKVQYSISTENNYRPQSSFRGHFSSFFSTAKHAGILDYKKVGGKFLMKKGPNFEAFKSGELRAL